MGLVIREYRRHPWHGDQPLPQERIARWGSVSQGHLSRLETGRAKITDLPRLIGWARALKVPEDFLWFRVPPLSARTPLNASRRRTLAPALLVQRVEPQVAAQIRSLLPGYSATDNLTGPKPLLGAVPTHLTHVERLLPNTAGQVRRDLLQTAARVSEFVGWLFQDAGDLQAATSYTDRALRYGHELGDPTLVAYALMRHSNIASDGRDGARALGFASSALQHWERLTPGLRALILRQQASGHTLLQNLSATKDAIDRGLEQAHIASTSGAEEADDLTGYCTPSYLEMESATCLVRLGRPEPAIDALERGLADWRPEFRRDLGLCLARAATAYSVVGDRDHAHEAAEGALIIASETKSARTIRELRDAQRAMATNGMKDLGLEVGRDIDSIRAGRSDAAQTRSSIL
ncbi:helix-turn-helix domain-containing protein [Nocardioides speluncae]|uniref:helix-turn-helix domain-containing protein n=1 Tax=Nocardioides speluncae TaxID=2670337 RepID=UPI0012B1830C|nr:helix-turn-helix transcriptional regulator [Nocardioides speluncae]